RSRRYGTDDDLRQVAEGPEPPSRPPLQPARRERPEIRGPERDSGPRARHPRGRYGARARPSRTRAREVQPGPGGGSARRDAPPGLEAGPHPGPTRARIELGPPEARRRVLTGRSRPRRTRESSTA